MRGVSACREFEIYNSSGELCVVASSNWARVNAHTQKLERATPAVAAVAFIGVITFVLSGIGIKIGNIFGLKFKKKAELAGGIILILMGAKILIEHLEIIEKISALIK
jgi:putative Mn2+ efflux pump MntP